MATNKPVFKLVLCGEYGVGKSSNFRRFVHDSFVENADRASTLGFDHFEKTYIIDGKQVVLQLWDTGGLERVASVTSSYFKHADGALLVFAYDAIDSFNALSQHLLEVLASAEHAKLFLCGNKLDLLSSDGSNGPTQEDVDTFYRENQVTENENLFKQMYKVSCKNNDGVHPMFEDIAHILAKAARPERPNPDHFRLRPSSIEQTPRKHGCGSCSNG